MFVVVYSDHCHFQRIVEDWLENWYHQKILWEFKSRRLCSDNSLGNGCFSCFDVNTSVNAEKDSVSLRKRCRRSKEDLELLLLSSDPLSVPKPCTMTMMMMMIVMMLFRSWPFSSSLARNQGVNYPHSVGKSNASYQSASSTLRSKTFFYLMWKSHFGRLGKSFMGSARLCLQLIWWIWYGYDERRKIGNTLENLLTNLSRNSNNHDIKRSFRKNSWRMRSQKIRYHAYL